MIFWLGGKVCIVKIGKGIAFPESRYVNSKHVKFTILTRDWMSLLPSKLVEESSPDPKPSVQIKAFLQHGIPKKTMS